MHNNAESQLRYYAALREQARRQGDAARERRDSTPKWRPAYWLACRQAERDAELRFDAANTLVRSAADDVKALAEAGDAIPVEIDTPSVQDHLMNAARGHAPWDRSAAQEREQDFMQARYRATQDLTE